MGDKNQLVVVPNRAWELKIPRPLVDGVLKSLMWTQFTYWKSWWYPDVKHNKLTQFPAAIFVSECLSVDNDHSSDKLSSVPYWKKRSINKPREIFIPESWIFQIPDNILGLFHKINSRTRLVILNGNVGDDNLGVVWFAFSFQDRFPGKK